MLYTIQVGRRGGAYPGTYKATYKQDKHPQSHSLLEAI